MIRLPKSSAWALWLSTLLATALTLPFSALNDASSLPTKVLLSGLILAFVTTGALLASRRPENAIGWLFCVGSLVWVLGELALEYAVYALVTDPGALPGGAWMTWVGGWARGFGWFIVVVFLLLLFPTGRLPSPRWRLVLRGAVAFLALFTLGSWLAPTSSDLRLSFVSHPLGLEVGVAEILEGLALLLSVPLIVAAATAAIVRFRRSSGIERQQLKWFAYAVGVMVVLFVLGLALAVFGFVAPTPVLWLVPLSGLPIATGLAILRYRLYDIDLIISRTLVHGALIATLGVVYVALVLGLQGVLSSVAGGDGLAVAGSTLAVAALFQPARHRIHRAVERRFYRSRYDAIQTLEAFGDHLRREVDLARLTEQLVDVVNDTLHPASVSVWLRGDR